MSRGDNAPWSTGRTRRSLEGHANVLDQKAIRHGLDGDAVSFDDGYVVHAPVGSFAANGFGLFDMHGNVHEWCEDQHNDSSRRVLRGGSFFLETRLARSASRFGYAAGVGYNYLGLRPARPIH